MNLHILYCKYFLFSYLYEHSWKCQSNAAFPHFLIENDLDKLCVLKSWNCPGVYRISSLVFEVVGSLHKADWGYWISTANMKVDTYVLKQLCTQVLTYIIKKKTFWANFCQDKYKYKVCTFFDFTCHYLSSWVKNH